MGRFIRIFYLVLIVIATLNGYSQNIVSQDQVDPNKIYVVTKQDGSQFIGKIITIDSREVVIQTTNMGEIAIPKHLIKNIKELKQGDLNSSGELITDDPFSSRYFYTTNGIPIDKGDSYIKWNLIGPDFQFAVADNLGIGIITTWLGSPIIGSIKYSIPVSDGFGMGVGALVGTGTWAGPSYAAFLPFGALTFGDNKRNINFAGGYGLYVEDGTTDGRMLLSVGGLTKIGNSVAFVFDSFISPSSANVPGIALLIPGIRLYTDERRAFQFGFGGIVIDGELLPFPLPMVNFFRAIR